MPRYYIASDDLRDRATPRADTLRWRLRIADAARRPLAALRFALDQSD